ncbi:MAG: PBP1A family penicillin-binding protein [Nitrospirae bacterium]|nr:PBP1A family penicillin-binding protein [Nitrospirota bacterium]MCL5978299.1 PBP1A family penicillin-binding protein [Nitrospirota bacterium]
MHWLKLLLITVISVVIGALGGFIAWNLSSLPEIKSLEGYTPMQSSFVYSSDGKVLAEFYQERRNFIPHYQIPERIKKAFIAVEDQRFYSHPGVDIIGILRALYKDLIAQSIVEGGSTITQQLAKMLFLKPEKSLSRKVREAMISVQIEKKYTKDEILGMYLNQAYFGTRAYGIEAAAQTYFDKPIRDLSLGEAALLAGLQKAPTLYSPFRNPGKALTRRQIVLTKMLESRLISRDEYERANAEPLPAKPNYRKYEAPYFVELLRQGLEAKYGNAIYISGIKVYSTVDYEMQKIAETAVANGIAVIEKRVRKGVQAALIAIDLRNGHIKALVGGNDFWETQFNRATMALRQPGSAFKPFVYAAALEDGMSETDEVLDEPVTFPGGKPNTTWSPKNYDGEYRGYIPMKTALALSLNSATVRLAHDVGIHNVIETAKKCGIKTVLQPYLPIALGASDVTLLELTSAYAAFATGNRIYPTTYERIISKDGVPLEEALVSSDMAFEPDIVDKMKVLLRAVVEAGTATKAKEIKRPVYGKTGTTNDFSDAWFIGFDDRLVVGVWVGRDNHKPIGPKEAGAKSALPIWIEFMKNIR